MASSPSSDLERLSLSVYSYEWAKATSISIASNQSFTNLHLRKPTAFKKGINHSPSKTLSWRGCKRQLKSPRSHDLAFDYLNFIDNDVVQRRLPEKTD